MRTLALPALLAVLTVFGAHAPASRRPTTSITVEAHGAAMEFRTFGLGEFSVADGASRTFTVRPGDYTIVQAPPVGVSTQVAPNEYVIAGGVLTQCSDGEQRVHRLYRGQALHCTYTTD